MTIPRTVAEVLKNHVTFQLWQISQAPRNIGASGFTQKALRCLMFWFVR
jgi:hypothetical protein